MQPLRDAGEVGAAGALAVRVILHVVSDEVDEPVHVAEWDPAWPTAGEALVAECRAALGEDAIAVEHIGSTAVPGLAAKPIIDVLIGVPLGRRTAVAEQLATRGWTRLGEAGVPGREHLRRRAGQHANVHVVEHGSTLWQDNLLLREHLRRDADALRRYAAAKRRAAGTAPTLLAYSEQKAAVVRGLLEQARRAQEPARLSAEQGQAAFHAPPPGTPLS